MLISLVFTPILRGLSRISLNADETKIVTFGMDSEKPAFHNREMDNTVEPGIFEIMTGSSSGDSDLQMAELIVE